MFRLLVLLCASLFLTMLIGGRDYGQARLGLQAAYEPPERSLPLTAPVRAVAQTAVQPEPPAAPAQVTLAAFSPAPLAEASPTEVRPLATTLPVVAAAPMATEAPALPVLYVKSRAVNVREGPSTAYGVIGRVVRAEAVSVVEPAVNGWVHIRMEGDGIEGFIAASLLSETDPDGN